MGFSISPSLLWLTALASSSVLAAEPAADVRPAIPEIVVTSQWREQVASEVPASVAVLDSDTIHQGTLQHFEELTSLVPNLNYSGDGNRARYFQIRGTGELEQYEGAPNPSVGFIVDDIDFSGIGGIATLFDMDRVEVLRGPQGTRYGANALAGLIYAKTADPTDTPEARVEATYGSDDTRALGGAVGGPVPGIGHLDYRVAVQDYHSDGFRRDIYLNRDDTNHRDELTARGKLRWEPDGPGGRWRVDLTGLYVDLNDGYDEWAVDNNGFHTYSDKPGRDAQRSLAGSMRVTGAITDAFSLVSITGVAHSDVSFGYDSDWGNDQFWAPYLPPGGRYDFTQAFDRTRRTVNQELRLLSSPAGRLFGRVDWVLGAYFLGLDESNTRFDHGVCIPPAICGFPDPPPAPDSQFGSAYSARNVALFGEFNLPMDDATRLTVGLRGEQRRAEYDDTAGNHFVPTDRMWGGELAVTRKLTGSTSAWARVARGYKAGGFNPSLQGLGFPADQITFGPEYLWDYEIGLRAIAPDEHWSVELTGFWEDRHDMQVKVPISSPGDPNTFVFLTDNAQLGRVFGLEMNLGVQVSASLRLYGTLGLLNTTLERFSAQPLFEGSEQPHAPPWSFAAGASYQGPGGWFARLDVAGRDAFLFDYDFSQGRDRKSQPYELVNLRLGREWRHWTGAFWVRNLFDENYAVRGFYFGNQPPDFPNTRYVRLGDPRQLGVTVSYRY